MVTWWMKACLCALFLISTCSSQCNKTVSVEVTSSGSVTLPTVNSVILWTDKSVRSWMYPNETHLHGQYIFVGAENSYYLLMLHDDTTYNVTLEFNSVALSCKNITLDLQVASRDFTCVPVSSCDNANDNDITRIRWLKAYYIDADGSDVDDYQELGSSGCDGFTQLGLSESPCDSIHFNDSQRENNSIISNGILRITGANARSAGYYIAVADSDVVLYQFTFYYGPEFYNSPSTESAKATLGADNFHEFSCLFQSFPSPRVTWYLNNEVVNQPNVRYTNISSNNNMMPNTTVTSFVYDYSWTLFGGLIINDVQYENAGRYRCSGSNGYMTAESSRLLRVRSPLRPLWPILGIIASFIITAVFIAAGYIVDKIRGEDKTTINQDEIDGNTSMPEKPLRENDSFSGNYGAFRPLSVNSFNEDDTKELYRRSSSAKELLPNQTS